MTPINSLARPVRWFGLELGDRRYAIDFRSVSTVFYQPAETPKEGAVLIQDRGPFIGIRGLMVHEGSPVFLLDPSRLFNGVDGPLDAGRHDQVSPDQESGKWIVIFAGDSLSNVGIRVDRASGPFKVAADTAAGVDPNFQKEIQYLDQNWTVVRLRPNVVEGLQGEAA
jgi:hypothetical protein